MRFYLEHEEFGSLVKQDKAFEIFSKLFEPK